MRGWISPAECAAVSTTKCSKIASFDEESMQSMGFDFVFLLLFAECGFNFWINLCDCSFQLNELGIWRNFWFRNEVKALTGLISSGILNQVL